MDISETKAGDHHYMAYVGPPTQYDFMGATQFRLLCSLGLRSDHHILDVGCGSLRAGRLFISYLDQGRYFGIEPNKWLIEDAVENQVGNDLINIKKPQFSYNSDFDTEVFSKQFDFIIAQSIFSHTGSDLIRMALENFKKSLKSEGLIAVTFVEGFKDFEGNGWVYPDCVRYRRSTITRFAKDAGLFAVRIPWYHPRQTWYLFSINKSRLPNYKMLRHLSGAVLFDSNFIDSYKILPNVKKFTKNYLNHILPLPVKNSIKKMLAK